MISIQHGIPMQNYTTRGSNTPTVRLHVTVHAVSYRYNKSVQIRLKKSPTTKNENIPYYGICIIIKFVDTPYKFKAPVIQLSYPQLTLLQYSVTPVPMHRWGTPTCPHAQVGTGVTKSISIEESIEEEINTFLCLSSECKIVWDGITPPTFMAC